MNAPAEALLQVARFGDTLTELDTNLQAVFSGLASAAAAARAATAAAVAAAAAAAADPDSQLPQPTSDIAQSPPAPSPIDVAAAKMALAEAVVALFHAHLRCRGADPLLPPYSSELERVLKYRKKVSKEQAPGELSRRRPTVSLDVAAANRFIDAAIPDLTKEQHAQLRNAAATNKRPLAAAAAAAQQDGSGGGGGGGTGTPGDKARKKAKKAGSKSSRDAAMHFLQSITDEARTEAAPPAGDSALCD